MRAITAPDLPEPAGHYAHATRAGGLLFVSGLLGVRLGTPGDAALDAGAQAAAVLGRLDRVLAAAGLGPADVARLGIYITDLAAWPAVNAVGAAHFGAHRPARTVVPCPALHYGSLVEVDAIAAFPESPA